MVNILSGFPNWPPDVQNMILNGPAMIPPKGVVPDLTNPPNHNRLAIAVAIVCLLFAAVAALCRIYSRAFIMKEIRLEDYFGLAAFGAYICLAWVYLDFLHHCGFYVHQYNLTVRKMISQSKGLTFGLTIAYSATLLFAKTAILLEWMRIFSPNRIHPRFYWGSYLMILLNTLLYVSSIISSAITCLPHESIWHPWVSGKCIDRKALGLATAFFNVIMDLVILILPQRIIWTLRMSPSRKFGVSMVFSVGLLATICAAGRVYATFSIEYPPGDSSYTVSPVMIWALPELTCVILVFCMPALPKVLTEQGPLFKMTYYIRSWTRISTPGRVKTSISAKASANGNYVGEEHGQPTSQVELNLVQEQPSPLPKQFQTHETSHPTIMRTTEVEQRNSSASRSSPEPWVELQHPWIGSKAQ